MEERPRHDAAKQPERAPDQDPNERFNGHDLHGRNSHGHQCHTRDQTTSIVGPHPSGPTMDVVV